MSASTLEQGRILEIEIETDQNNNLFFLPLQQQVRGRFEIMRTAKHDPNVMMLFESMPRAIPGQHIRLDLDRGEGSIVEPLHPESDTAGEHRAIRAWIEKRNCRLDTQPVRVFPDVHVPTWLFWMKRAVTDGTARLVCGSLPDKIEGTPQVSMLGTSSAGQRTAPAEQRRQAEGTVESRLDRLADLMTQLAQIVLAQQEQQKAPARK